MYRIEALHREIQKIKRSRRKGYRQKGKWVRARKLASNAELARYCGVDENETHRWFWSAKPKILPKATMTLKALRWVCAVRKVPADLIPKWDALWFCFSYGLCRGSHNLRAAQQTAGYSQAPKKLYVSSETAQESAARYGITCRSVKRYAQYPWGRGKSSKRAISREPDGNFALEVLAENLSRERFVDYLTFLELDLPKFPYHEIPKPIRDEIAKEHENLAKRSAEYWEYFTAQQRNEQKLYSYYRKSKPGWLRRILF